MTLYELRYERSSDGQFRTITFEADSKAEAKKIAEARLAKQFPDEEANPHSGYELKGVATK